LNLEEYISSGILEAYALGELSHKEREEVEKNLKLFPALREELYLIENLQEVIAHRTSIAPPAHLKDKIMVSVHEKGKIISLTNDNVLKWKYAAAASIGIALFTTYMAYNYRAKWQHSQHELVALNAKSQQVAQDFNQVNFKLDKIEKDLKVITSAEFERVIMKGTPQSPEALASVYWSKQTQEVFVSIQNMRTLSKEKQYQLWAIIDGKAVDAGVFDGNVTGLIKMKNIVQGVTMFAVTIEDAGGKPTPSLETMQVAGTVSKG
jgi:anti-sigma-K factor RskA